jgi:geranylgeranyl diphosphate synthase type 3
VYGVAQTVNTANYVYFLAYRELAYIRSPATASNEFTEALSQAQRLFTERYLETILTDELINLHRGQGLDLLWRDTLQCPTEEEYLAMVNDSQ